MWMDADEYDNSEPPKKYPKYHQYELEWRKLHPTWTSEFWNRRRIENLWNHPRLEKWKNFYYSLDRLIERCDFSRYAILWLYGGVYHDLDVVPGRAIDSLITHREFGWSYEPLDHVNSEYASHRFITNSFLCSSPNHWIWPKLMDFIANHYNSEKSPVATTGPGIIAGFAEKVNLATTHPEYFIDTCLIIPLDKMERVASECPKDTLSRAYSYTRWSEGTYWNISNPMLLAVVSNKNLILTTAVILILLGLIVYLTSL